MQDHWLSCIIGWNLQAKQLQNKKRKHINCLHEILRQVVAPASSESYVLMVSLFMPEFTLYHSWPVQIIICISCNTIKIKCVFASRTISKLLLFGTAVHVYRNDIQNKWNILLSHILESTNLQNYPIRDLHCIWICAKSCNHGDTQKSSIKGKNNNLLLFKFPLVCKGMTTFLLAEGKTDKYAC